MTLSYDGALRIIQKEAKQQAISPICGKNEEALPLVKAINRISKHDYTSPRSTPQFDTSAMDGYALDSAATVNASAESPAQFCVQGTIAAGDEPIAVSGEPKNGVYPCVEIMTGARFPICTDGEPFDCCVRVEDTSRGVGGNFDSSSYIKVTKAARKEQNRRLAGNDFQKGDIIISAGSVVRPNHIISLASVGIQEITVFRKPRIAVLSTGSELISQNTQEPQSHRIPDVNGPYLTASLEDWGADVDFLGAVDDGAETFSRTIKEYLDRHDCDVIISTGAVSAGRYDLVRTGIEQIGARVVFHKLAMRPGHPALFAIIAKKNGQTAFFGLPGNPVASAACLQFLVMPFLRTLYSRVPEPTCKATVRGDENAGSDPIATFPLNMDVFRPAISHSTQQFTEVSLIADHSPGKVKPFLTANCWIHIPAGKSELKEGDTVDIIPLNLR